MEEGAVIALIGIIVMDTAVINAGGAAVQASEAVAITAQAAITNIKRSLFLSVKSPRP